MVHKALNDGAGFTGACRGTAAAAGTAGAAVSLQGNPAAVSEVRWRSESPDLSAALQRRTLQTLQCLERRN